MPDLFRVEVTELTKISSLEALAAQKSLFHYISAFYRNVAELDGSAPEGPSSAKGLDGLLGPMVEHVRLGGSCETTANHTWNAFMTSLVKNLAAPETATSPLPISNVTIRVEEISAQGGMPREISGASSLFASLLALGQGPNPLRDHFGDAIVTPSKDYLRGAAAQFVITGNFGTARNFTNPEGEKRKRTEVSAWVYSKWVPHLSLGKSWQVDLTV